MKKKNLVWIDNDGRLIDNCMPIFQENGFNIFKATNTSRALTILREESDKLDGILLDVRLSEEESGLELLKEISSRDTKLPVVVFTAYPDYHDHVISEQLGATYFEKIDKSIPLDEEKQRNFFQALHKLFSKKSTTDEPKHRGSLDETKQLLNSDKSNQNVKSNTINWINGLFFIFLLIMILLVISVFSKIVDPWIFPIALISCLLLFVLIGSFILRTQGNVALNQKNFLTLILNALRLLPLIRKKSK
jgi:FixJ family two-component response regulator